MQKIADNTLREAVNIELARNGCFEALLLNEKNEITEGSRSNAFFLKGNTIYTASGKNVLLGVTRNKIIDICNKNNIKVCYESLNKEDINDIEGGFLSGTSINILPISKIGDRPLNSSKNPLILKLMSELDDDIKEYICKKKNIL